MYITMKHISSKKYSECNLQYVTLINIHNDHLDFDGKEWQIPFA